MEILLRNHEIRLSQDLYTLALSMWKSQYRVGEALTYYAEKFAKELGREPTEEELTQHICEKVIEEAKVHKLPWRHLYL